MGTTDGMSLNFTPFYVVDGVKIARISREDVISEVDLRKSAVVYCVLGINPPFKHLEGFFYRIWKNLGLETVVEVSKGVCMARFASVEQRDAIVKLGRRFFDK